MVCRKECISISANCEHGSLLNVGRVDYSSLVLYSQQMKYNEWNHIVIFICQYQAKNAEGSPGPTIRDRGYERLHFLRMVMFPLSRGAIDKVENVLWFWE